MQAFDDWVWLDDWRTVGREEMARMCGVSEPEFDELVDYGALPTTDDALFPADLVVSLREAIRLRSLFDLDLFTAGLLVHYLRRIESLERKVRELRPSSMPPPAPREGPAPWHEPHATTHEQ